jgi:hypothetical protein
MIKFLLLVIVTSLADIEQFAQNNQVVGFPIDGRHHASRATAWRCCS